MTRRPRVAGLARDGSRLRTAKQPPDPASVQSTLRKAAKLEPSIYLGVLATLPAIANVPGIWTAASNLQSGAGGSLDKGANNAMTSVINKSGERWIAADQQQFATAAGTFRVHLDALRTNLQWVAGHVDSIGDGIAVYWFTAGKIAQETYLRLAALQALALVPQSRLAARVAMRRTGGQANVALAEATGKLQRFMHNLTIKDVVGGIAAGIGGTAAVQLAFMRPAGSGTIDFGKAAIDTSNPVTAATFTAPATKGQLPDGAQLFDWQVKNGDGHQRLDELAREQAAADRPPPAPAPTAPTTRPVRHGESLGEIAREEYGDSSRWREIYEANRALVGANPDHLKTGTPLQIPPA